MNVIDYLGGTVAAASFFKVSPQVVTNWRNRNNGLPKSWQITAIEMGIPAHVVRPDLFGVPLAATPVEVETPAISDGVGDNADER